MDAIAFPSAAQTLVIELLDMVMLTYRNDGDVATTPAEILKLAHVCRHWRDVALSQPRLWAQLAITLRQLATPRDAQQVMRWFRRASPHQVDLQIGDPQDSSNLVVGTVVPLVLLRVTAQLRELRIYCDRDWFQLLASLPDDAFPALQRLRIEASDQTQNTAQTITWTCPRLEQLSLYNITRITARDSLADIMHAPWAQMQELVLTGTEAKYNVGPVFFQCVRLRRAELVLNGAFFDNPARRPAEIVTFPFLTSLSVTFEVFPVELATCARFPALDVLRLYDDDWWNAGNPWGALYLLAEQSTQVKDLTLTFFDLTGDGQSDPWLLFERLPQLTRLVLRECCIYPQEAGYMATTATDGSVLLPNLEVLHYEDVSLAPGGGLEDNIDLLNMAYGNIRSFIEDYVVCGLLPLREFHASWNDGFYAESSNTAQGAPAAQGAKVAPNASAVQGAAPMALAEGQSAYPVWEINKDISRSLRELRVQFAPAVDIWMQGL
ncbi:uncharacterized protein SCHCODRAFT_02006913 [Schizophyllum commune H4-8]|uniref:Expressed protein n=1 Tax=Schizophyllum commune (strain H4-8 / FGSC 9210) TaxID=578458 RepID=D8PTM6_SCHCM|nr:uncharacterized protein SCHCODRAFT_02006913 [Schizophyllum commune H4-8]KAI5899248.1 hypothetical protein SCHCODRAFT_02006913 [Schizophyllum commune H4-8]